MRDKFIKAVSGFAAGVCNGIFGSGGGTVIVPCMEKLLKTEAHKAHATAVAVIMPLSIISGIIYFYGMPVPPRELVFACIGGFFGGMAGARLLGRINARQLHIIFGVFMLICGVRMLF